MDFEIVIVEDNSSDVVLLRHALAAHEVSYRATILKDGDEAIEYIRSASAQTKRPSLIILDLNLPKRDGIEVLSAIRSSPQFRSAPVAMLTTSDSPAEKERAEAIGVQQYLRKPIDLEPFLQLGAVFKAICEGPPVGTAGA